MSEMRERHSTQRRAGPVTVARDPGGARGLHAAIRSPRAEGSPQRSSISSISGGLGREGRRPTTSGLVGPLLRPRCQGAIVHEASVARMYAPRKRPSSHTQCSSAWSERSYLCPSASRTQTREERTPPWPRRSQERTGRRLCSTGPSRRERGHRCNGCRSQGRA